MTNPIWENWSKQLACAPEQIISVSNEADLIAATNATTPIRAAGSGHSFSPIVPTNGTLLQLDDYQGIVDADASTGFVTVKAGTQIRELGPQLWELGLGLPNQGDIDHQTIAGAISTGTHGTGIGLGSISTQVVGMKLVDGTGTVHDLRFEDDRDRLDAARVSLGTLGLLSEITLATRSNYRLAEEQWAAHVDKVLDDWPTMLRQHRHLEFFWFPHDDRVIVKTLDEETGAHEGWPEAKPLPPIGFETTEDVMFQSAATTLRFFPQLAPATHRALMDGIRPERRRGPSHLMFPSPRNARFNEMEYALPADIGPQAVRAVAEAMRTSDIACMWPLEYRHVAGDSLWLSPFYDRDSVTISVHQYGPVDPAPLFNLVEPILRSFGGRPHWGKMHNLTANELRALYPRFDDFCNLRAGFDPDAKFLTPYLRSLFDG